MQALEESYNYITNFTKISMRELSFIIMEKDTNDLVFGLSAVFCDQSDRHYCWTKRAP